jgi:hypothetical protein
MAQVVRPRYIIALPGAAKRLDLLQLQMLAGNAGNNKIKPFNDFSRPSAANVAIAPWVSSLDAPNAPAATATITFGGAVVERHPLGYREWYTITLGGSIGPLPFLDPKANSNQKVIVPSWGAYLAFEALIKQAVAAKGSGTLHLYCVYEGIFVEVLPIRGPALSRSPARKTMADWSVTFRVLGEVKPPQFDVWWTKLKVAPSTRKKHEVTLAETKTSALGAIASARVSVTKAIRTVTRAVQKALDLANAWVDEFDKWSKVLIAVAHWPERVLSAARSLVWRAHTTLGEVMRLGSVYARKRWMGTNGFFETGNCVPGWDEASRAYFALKDATAETYDNVHAAEVATRMLGQAADGRVEYWPVKSGDTIESIAAAVAGDPSVWPALAALNDLRYPYLSDDGTPGTLAPGALLKLPTSADESTGNTAPLAGEMDEVALYGRDKLVRGGDLVLTETGDGVDFAMVEGVACAAQNLRLRLDTPVGANRLFDVGLPMEIGDAPEATAAALTLATQTEILRDDRFVRADDLRVQDRGNGWSIEATAYLTNGKQVPAAASGGGA